MHSLRERDAQLREQTKLREEWEAASNKSSNALAAIKIKMDRMKHDLDERSKQANCPYLGLDCTQAQWAACRAPQPKKAAQKRGLGGWGGQVEGLERQLAAAVKECDALQRTRSKDTAQAI